MTRVSSLSAKLEGKHEGRDRVIVPVMKSDARALSLDLNEILQGMQDPLRRLLGGDIDVVLDLSPDAGTIEADPAQIQRAILNLVLNARDAMPEGGLLTLETRIADGQSASGRRCREVVISVVDTGRGMDEDTQARAFEPFFSTKGAGRGLGLFVVRQVAALYEGRVELDSAPDKGTRIRIALPQADGPEPANERALAHGGPGRGVTVLLVDDDTDLRELLADVLDVGGFDVVQAGGGIEALDLLGKRTDIAALVTDMKMPGMDGDELARRAVAIRPHLKVLYLSGYLRSNWSASVLVAGSAMLTKPIPPDTLINTLKQLLSGITPAPEPEGA